MFTAEHVILFLLGGFVIWALWRASRGNAVFSVRIVEGQPTRDQGTVTAAFLQEVHEIARQHQIAAGQVWGVAAGGGRISLKFSREFPPEAQQQLRNWWVVSGWSYARVRRK